MTELVVYALGAGRPMVIARSEDDRWFTLTDVGAKGTLAMDRCDVLRWEGRPVTVVKR